jgi:hypothetical protein
MSARRHGTEDDSGPDRPRWGAAALGESPGSEHDVYGASGYDYASLWASSAADRSRDEILERMDVLEAELRRLRALIASRRAPAARTTKRPHAEGARPVVAELKRTRAGDDILPASRAALTSKRQHPDDATSTFAGLSRARRDDDSVSAVTTFGTSSSRRPA